jgi:hypothetical protein
MASGKTYPNSWEGVVEAAKDAGAKWPTLVAAQWALESGWGKHTPAGAPFNYFGLKGDNDTASETKEFVGGRWITISAEFIDFPDLFSCVEYLVSRWYRDFRKFKGVNRAGSIEAAARELQRQGYATDPAYPEKLLKIVRAQAAKQPVAPPKVAEQPILFRLVAAQDTFLKKEPKQASDLGGDKKVAVSKGRVYAVSAYREMPGDGHAEVFLGGGPGTWCIFEAHWRKLQASGEAMPSQVDWRDFDCMVTTNLTVGEILQWDRRRVPTSDAVKQTLLNTASQFQQIRAAWGKPLGVTSFYRPEPINSQVGGVRGSKHTTGEAFDIYPAGGSLNEFYNWLRPRWSGGLGDGRNRGFVHCDTRNGGRFHSEGGVKPCAEWPY